MDFLILIVIFTGKVIVEKLDVDDVSEEAGLYQMADDKMMFPLLKERIFDGYKGTYGHTCLITGCIEYKGAALLSAKVVFIVVVELRQL